MAQIQEGTAKRTAIYALLGVAIFALGMYWGSVIRSKPDLCGLRDGDYVLHGRTGTVIVRNDHGSLKVQFPGEDRWLDAKCSDVEEPR